MTVVGETKDADESKVELTKMQKAVKLAVVEEDNRLKVVVRGKDRNAVHHREVRDLVYSMRYRYKGFEDGGLDPVPTPNTVVPKPRSGKQATSTYELTYFINRTF